MLFIFFPNRSTYARFYLKNDTSGGGGGGGGMRAKGGVKPNRAVEDLLTQLQSRWLQRGEGQIAFEDNVFFFFLFGLYTDALNI